MLNRIDAQVSQQPAWIWQAELVSRFDADGTGTHVAVYQLENTGLGQLTVTLPPVLDTRKSRSMNASHVRRRRPGGRRSNSLCVCHVTLASRRFGCDTRSWGVHSVSLVRSERNGPSSICRA